MQTNSLTRSRGFTLLEVLVAMAIFAVISIMGITGYTQLMRQSEHVTDNMKRVRAIQLAMMRLAQDFGELEPRPIRDPLGSNSEPALLADARSQALVQLTRAGWSNPAAIARSTLQRVAYRVVDGKLLRDHWPVLDRTLATEPIEVELLDHVRTARLRFLDRNRAWSDQWPANNLDGRSTTGAAITATTNGAGASAGNLADRPLAVEVTLELDDWGTLVRLIEVPG